MIAALKLLVAIALVGAGLPSEAGTRVGGINTGAEASTGAASGAAGCAGGSAPACTDAAASLLDLASGPLSPLTEVTLARRFSDGAAAKGVPASTAVGRKGAPTQNASYQPVQNAPTTISGREYTGHALDQMRNRGLTPSVIEDTIARGTQSAGRDGARIFQTDQARVFLNPNGSVKTVMPMSQ